MNGKALTPAAAALRAENPDVQWWMAETNRSLRLSRPAERDAWRMVPPVLTLLLLVFAVLLGARMTELRSALPLLVIAWAVVMIVNFLVAGVADDDDIGAFVASAVVVLVVCVGLFRLGAWLKQRRRPAA